MFAFDHFQPLGLGPFACTVKATPTTINLNLRYGSMPVNTPDHRAGPSNAELSISNARASASRAFSAATLASCFALVIG